MYFQIIEITLFKIQITKINNKQTNAVGKVQNYSK